MNYKEVNSAILEGRDVDLNIVQKNDQFYEYLFNNKVAYYYSSELSEKENDIEKWIISRGDELNARYIKTLEYTKSLCDKNDIDFILFKTHKIVPEVVDGDIDLIVKRKDFQKFLDVFEEQGFDCIEDEPGKGKCEKEGYNVIEPHITISWRGNSYFEPDTLWNEVDFVEINGEEYAISNSKLEEFIAVVQVFYEPEYIDLYSALKISDKQNEYLKNLTFSKNIYSFKHNVLAYRHRIFPVFAPVILFSQVWTAELFRSKNISTYLMHWVFYIYWRIRYRLIRKLPFTHEWK